MWIFTNFGFVSAVQHNTKKNTLLVRAREPGVLQKLASRHNVRVFVTKTPFADYLYRAEFPKKKFAEIIANEVARINYGNFKNSFSSPIKANTNRSHIALMDVWVTMHGLQNSLEYGMGKDQSSEYQLDPGDFPEPRQNKKGKA